MSPVLDNAWFGVGVPVPLISEAEKAVISAIEAHPGIAMILADDDLGISGADRARESLAARGRFALVGFMADPKSRRLVDVARARQWSM